jgi:hypothetical protein
MVECFNGQVAAEVVLNQGIKKTSSYLLKLYSYPLMYQFSQSFPVEFTQLTKVIQPGFVRSTSKVAL